MQKLGNLGRVNLWLYNELLNFRTLEQHLREAVIVCCVSGLIEKMNVTQTTLFLA